MPLSINDTPFQLRSPYQDTMYYREVRHGIQTRQQYSLRLCISLYRDLTYLALYWKIRSVVLTFFRDAA